MVDEMPEMSRLSVEIPEGTTSIEQLHEMSDTKSLWQRRVLLFTCHRHEELTSFAPVLASFDRSRMHLIMMNADGETGRINVATHLDLDGWQAWGWKNDARAAKQMRQRMIEAVKAQQPDLVFVSNDAVFPGFGAVCETYGAECYEHTDSGFINDPMILDMSPEQFKHLVTLRLHWYPQSLDSDFKSVQSYRRVR